MKLFYILVALLLNLQMCGNAKAERAQNFINGKRLIRMAEAGSKTNLSAMTNEELFDSLAYRTYISATSDSFDGWLFCRPEGVPSEILAGVVSKYLRETQVAYDENASRVIVAALSREYPCKWGGNKK